MQTTGGRVLAVEPDAAKIKIANESFTKAKLAPYISIASGKALDVLPTLSGPFDLAFVDATKSEYLAYVAHLRGNRSVSENVSPAQGGDA